MPKNLLWHSINPKEVLGILIKISLLRIPNSIKSSTSEVSRRNLS